MRQTGYLELALFGRETLPPGEWDPEPGKTGAELGREIEAAWQEEERFGLLRSLRRRFRLTGAEEYLLFLSFLPEDDSRFGGAFDLVGGEGGRPSVSLALRMWACVHGGGGTGETEEIRPGFLKKLFFRRDAWPVLKLRSCVTEYLSGWAAEEEGQLPLPREEEEPEAFRNFSRLSGRRGLFYLQGPEGSGRGSCFRLMAAELGLSVLWSRGGEELEEQCFLAAARDRAFFLAEPEEAGRMEPYLPYLSLAAVAGREREETDRFFSTGEWISVLFKGPDLGERYQIWRAKAERQAGEVSPALEEELRLLANQYDMTPGEIDRSLKAALQADSLEEGQEAKHPVLTRKALREGIRRILKGSFMGKALPVAPLKNWEALALPEKQKRKLREACRQLKFRHLVMEQWGLSEVMAYGRGVSLVFAGPPGTGKTMAARAVAGELSMDLYKVELAAVVSKFVGETEKNLDIIFEQAKKSQVILFFDEADVLFSKRTEVREANDKYSNMEAAFLLQKMEQYDGVVILATNFLKNMDEAFRRRMKFIVEFPFPGAEERKAIWEKAFPSSLPREELDLDFLAERFELSGSNIRNVVYHSAFLAAADKTPLSMEHLMDGIRNEYEKTGKLLSKEEEGPYGV